MDVRQMILALKPDLQATIGSTINDDIDKVLTQLMNMSDILEPDFSKIRSQLHTMENNVIKVIND